MDKPSDQSFKIRPGGRPGPRPGFRVLAGSPGLTGSAGSILKKKKSKRRRFSKKNKKKSHRVCHRVLPGQPGRPTWSAGLHRVFPSLVFSSTRPGYTGFFLPSFFHQPGPVPAPGRPGPGSTRRAEPGFKTMPMMKRREKSRSRGKVENSEENLPPKENRIVET